MPTSKGSSTRETTWKPSELDVLRALHEPAMPCWSEEPLAALLAEKMGTTTRAVRPVLDAIDVRIDIAGPLLGCLDETWLFRAPTGGAPFAERVQGAAGLVEWELLDGRYALMRMIAQDAVGRERGLRDLHKRLHERPLQELHREHPPLPKRKLARVDWALLSAMRRKPFAPLDALAAESGTPLRAAKDRAPKLAAGGLAAIVAAPRAGPLARVLVRVSPSSTAAARQAIAAFDRSLLRAWLPPRAEASLVDAAFLAPSSEWAALRERALDVPGVASVEPLAVTSAWRDDAAFDALVKRAFNAASP